MLLENPYISADTLLNIMPDIILNRYCSEVCDMDYAGAVDEYIDCIFNESDDAIKSLMESALNVDMDKYVHECVKVNAPLYFPPAVELAKRDMADIRKYSAFTNPCVEVYEQEGMVHVATILGMDCFAEEDASEETVTAAIRKRQKELYNTANRPKIMDDTEAVTFIGYNISELPVCIAEIGIDSYRWLLNREGTVSAVLCMDVQDEPDDIVATVYDLGGLFCCPSEYDACDVEAIKEMVSNAGFDVRDEERRVLAVKTSA